MDNIENIENINHSSYQYICFIVLLLFIMITIRLIIPHTILPLIFAFLTVREHVTIVKNVCKLWRNTQALREIITITDHLEQYIYNIIHMRVLNAIFIENIVTDNDLKILLLCKNLQHLDISGCKLIPDAVDHRLSSDSYIDYLRSMKQLIEDLNLYHVYKIYITSTLVYVNR